MIKTGKEWVISELVRPGDVLVVKSSPDLFYCGDEFTLDSSLRVKHSAGRHYFLRDLRYTTFSKKESAMTIKLSGDYAQRNDPLTKVKVLSVDAGFREPVVYLYKDQVYRCATNGSSYDARYDLVPWVDKLEEAYQEYLNSTSWPSIREAFVAGWNAK